MQLNFAKSQDQIVDNFTKPLKFEEFRILRMLLGVINQVEEGMLESKLDLKT